jgi:hypothetical protein
MKNIKTMHNAVGTLLERRDTLNEREFVVIDPRGNAKPVGMKTQGAQYVKKMGGPAKGYFMVLAKNALKARRAIEKAHGSFKNSKLQDTMFDLMYESKLTEAKNLSDMKDVELVSLLDHIKTGPSNLRDKGFIQKIEKELKKRGVKEGKLKEAAPKMKENKDAVHLQELMDSVANAQKGGSGNRYGKDFDKAKTKALRALKDMVMYSKIGI